MLLQNPNNKSAVKPAPSVPVFVTAAPGHMLPDSGNRQNFETGAMREPATGKGRFDLISPVALTRLAKHYENGAVKYAPRNWEKGLPAERMMDSAMRHIVQYLAGDDSEDHLSAAAWNIFCVMHFEERLPEMLKGLPERWKDGALK